MGDNVHFMSETVEWSTPSAFFDELDREFGFTVDVAANSENAKCDKFYTINDDGLSQSWDGEVVWCNPPYGRIIKDWVAKAAKQVRGTVVMLIPARTDTRWFHDHIYEKQNVEVRFIKGRLKFGSATANAPFPSMVVVFRSEGKELNG